MKPVISTIKDIYPSSQAEAQKQRYKSAVTAFAEHFGSIGEHRFFSAPGRTEICGNHTDHNHGKVFAASVNLDVIAVVEPTEDDKIVIKSEGFPEDSVDLSQLAVVPEEKNTSASLIRGVAAVLRRPSPYPQAYARRTLYPSRRAQERAPRVSLLPF